MFNKVTSLQKRSLVKDGLIDFHCRGFIKVFFGRMVAEEFDGLR